MYMMLQDRKNKCDIELSLRSAIHASRYSEKFRGIIS